MKRLKMIVLFLAGGLIALAPPVSAARAKLASLDRLQPGLWELRMRDKSGGVEKLCLQSGRQLIQLRHPALQCDQLVLTQSDSEVIMHYTCHGQGYGRTHIRSESDQLIQIDSQGIAGGAPFAFAAEARRIGNCQHQ